jgi:hypothetical protein
MKSVQFLMNARAKCEAINRMDAGDFVGAQAILGDALRETSAACAPLLGRPDVRQECDALEDTKRSLTDRLMDKMSRKKLAYQAYSRSTGK